MFTWRVFVTDHQMFNIGDGNRLAKAKANRGFIGFNSVLFDRSFTFLNHEILMCVSCAPLSQHWTGILWWHCYTSRDADVFFKQTFCWKRVVCYTSQCLPASLPCCLVAAPAAVWRWLLLKWVWQHQQQVVKFLRWSEWSSCQDKDFNLLTPG